MRLKETWVAPLLGASLLLTALPMASPAFAGELPKPGSSSTSTTGQRTAHTAVGKSLTASTDRVITFDEYAVGTKITDQYGDIAFTGEGGTPFITPDSDNPNSPVLSGASFGASISATFRDQAGLGRTVNHLALDVGYIDQVGSTEVLTYDAQGDMLETIPITETGIVTVNTTVPDIATFEIKNVPGGPQEGAGWAIDNLVYPTGPPRTQEYVAIGDSFSSGEGVRPFDSGTHNGADTCHRSSKAWPRLLAQKPANNLVLSGFFACSGATSTAITSKSFKTEAPQIQQVNSLITAPDVLTITIGGNDVGFADILTKCYVGIGCGGRINEASGYIRNKLPSVLADTFAQLRNAPILSQTRIIVVGYPNLMNRRSLNALGHCPWLNTRGHASSLVKLATDLDAAMSNAAGAAGVEYDSALTALQGHELCTGDSYVNPLAPAGGQLRGHPNAKGQERLANDVGTYLRDRADR